MGRNSHKNRRERKQAQDKDEKEKELKFDDADQMETEHSINVKRSSTESDVQFVKENWTDEDPPEVHTKKRQHHPKNDTSKDVHEKKETIEGKDKPSKKNRKRGKQTNTRQDHDSEMECQENKIPDLRSTQPIEESEPSEEWKKCSSKKSRKKGKKMDNHQDHDKKMEWQENIPNVSNKPTRSNNENKTSRDCDEYRSKKTRDNSSQRKEDSYKHDRDLSQRRNSSQKRDRQYSPHQKNNSQKGDRYNSSYQKHHSQKHENVPRPRYDSRQKYKDYSEKHFRDSNSGNYSNNRSYHDTSENSQNNQRNLSNRRSDSRNNENSNRQNKDNYEPPHRRPGRTQSDQSNFNVSTEDNDHYGRKDSHQNRNRHYGQESQIQPFEKYHSGRTPPMNNFQKNDQPRKKINKQRQPLFVPNAEHYEPTIREIEGDLFESGEEYSLAHCVAEDLSMGAGIAVEFKKRFKGVNYLWNQNKRTGEVAILQKDNRWIFYMITKTRSNGKPTIDSITKSIQSLKQSCLEFNVKKLAIPRIGCGLDRLDWGEVKDILYDEFRSTDIEIVVYVL